MPLYRGQERERKNKIKPSREKTEEFWATRRAERFAWARAT